MNFTLSRICFRLLLPVTRNSVIRSRSLCPMVVKSQDFCSVDAEIRIQNPGDYSDEFEDVTAGYETLQNVDYDAIVGDDPEARKNLQLIVLKLIMQLQSGEFIAPKRITAKHWHYLMMKRSDAARTKYLKILYFREKKKEIRTARQLERREHSKNEKKSKCEACTTSSPLTYALSGNSLFFRIYPNEISRWKDYGLAMACMFGQDLIVDCSYENYMTSAENFASAKQILFMWTQNRDSKNPFNLILSNVDPNGKLKQNLPKVFNTLEYENMFVNVTEKHYLDLYPAKQLVYLSPHSKTELEEYDPSSVYIIGAYIDEVVSKPVSLAKAKHDGIRHAKFPLDRYLNWAQGTKLLPINQVLAIMNDLKDGGCWQYAFRHVAVRKQVFQFLDNNINFKRNNNSFNSLYVRDSVRRDMLRDLNIRQFPVKTDENDSASNPK